MIGSACARRAALLGIAGALTAATPASAGELLDTTVSVAAAKTRVCHATPLASGRGFARTGLTVPAEGYLSVRLAGRRGDWDVAVFSGRRLVAASASRGARELAQGFVRAGQKLTLQACRRSGRARTAALTVSLVEVDLGAHTAPIKLVEIETPRDEDVDRLASLGLDLTEHGEAGHREAVIYTAAQERLLRAAGFEFSVTIPDLAAASRADRLADRRFAAATRSSALPSGRDGYRRLADFQQEMKDLAAAHPDLVKPITLERTSLEGRAVEGIEITHDVDAQDGKPVFLMTGVHHAREWPSAENPFEFAIELVDGFGSDERITDLLRRARVIVVPVMNVDGFNLSREAPDDGTLYEYKRKNCRLGDGVSDVPGACARIPEQSGTGAGVDPNRNYGGDWGGPGASTLLADATYRGAAPFSEPEVDNVRRLISSRQVTTFITNHTQGSLILRPPGIRAFGPTIDEPLYKTLGDTMAASNKYTSQYSFNLYDTSGTAEAWSYYATGGLGFTFEIHKGNFHRAYSDAVVEEYAGTTENGGAGGNRGAYFTALESTADTARHAVVEGRAPRGSTLTISRTVTDRTSRVQPMVPVAPWGAPLPITDSLQSEMVVPKSQRFEWHVNPSTSPDVQGGREPRGPTTQDVTFTATAATDRAFSVAPGDDNGALKVRADWPTNVAEDWSLELLRKNADGTLTQISRSAVGQRAFEEVETVHATPGDYVVRVTPSRAAAAPATVTLDFVAPQPATAWTLTCESPKGKRETTEVFVDRGERVDVGRLCS